MKDEIKEILDRMQELVKHKYDKKIQTYNLFDDIQCLLDYINNLQEDIKAYKQERKNLLNSIQDIQKENKRLKEYERRFNNLKEDLEKEISKGNVSAIAFYNPNGNNMLYTQKYVEEKDKEIEKLNNIIDELESYCLSWKENDKYCYLASNDKDKCRYDIWEEVLDKLKELKEGK